MRRFVFAARLAVLVAAVPSLLAAGPAWAAGRGAAPGRVVGADLMGSVDGSWERLPPPPGRASHTAIYDPVRERMVVFGGEPVPTGEVWALSLTGNPVWEDLTPATSLPTVTRHSAIYDPVRDRVIVFGGQSNSALLNDVWTVSLAGEPAWTHLEPAGSAPAPRSMHTAIYDPVRDRMIVFGGKGAALYGDVWSLSLGATPTWTQLVPEGVPPAARSAHTAIYDPVRDRMVVFGGGPYINAIPLDDVWALSLAGDPTWVQLAPSGTAPLWQDCSAIYDPERDRMLVFGGYRYDQQSFSYVSSETHALSFQGESAAAAGDDAGAPAWSLISAPADPSGRHRHSAILDPVHDRMVVFGGHDDSGYRNSPRNIYFADTWVLPLAGSAWSLLLAGAPSPGNVAGFSTLYDAVRERMVRFGGGGSTPDPPYYFRFYDDTWALAMSAVSADWSAVPVTGTRPPGRLLHTAVYDSARDRMVVFGGLTIPALPAEDVGVWALPLAGTPAWTQIPIAGTPPAARERHSAVYDPVRDRMIVFGGRSSGTYGDVWSLTFANPPTWVPLAPGGTPPSPRFAHSAIYDPVRDRMVVFGGDAGGLVNDVWALSLGDSPAWIQLTPEGAPPTPRSSARAIYDSARDRMVVFGGQTGSSLYDNDTWALSFGSVPEWTSLAPAGTPPGAGYGQMAIYDPQGDRMVVPGSHGEVWELVWTSTLGAGPDTGGVALRARVYPNPSPGAVRIDFVLPRGGPTSLRLLDVTGREVRTLVNGARTAGTHSVRWDRRTSTGALAPPGLYFCEVRIGGGRLVRKVALTR